MRSVLTIFREANREALEAHLDDALTKNGREWREDDRLFVRFYEEAAVEFEPELIYEIQRLTGRAEVLALIADVSGRFPGDTEAFSFCDRLLSKFEFLRSDRFPARAELISIVRASHGEASD